MTTEFISLQEKKKTRINERVKNTPPSGIRAFFDLVSQKEDVISLGVGEPDFTTPWHICEAGIHSLEIGQTCYTSNSGMLELREEAASYIKEYHGGEYNPNNELLVTVGGSEAIDVALRTILQPNEEVLISEPCFVAYKPLTALAGGVPVPVPTHMENGFLPRIEDLEAALTPNTKAILLNSPNNPTGAVIPKELIDKIAEFALRNDLLIISDEIYTLLSYDGLAPSFSDIPELHNNLILIIGFSKAWAMTGWRLGIVAAPPDIVAGMTKIHQYSIMCAPTFAQMGALEALRHGHDEVNRMVKEYDARRRYISHHFNRLGLTCLQPKGAFYVFPSIRSSGLRSDTFAKNLLESQNVAVVPGTAFGECGEGFIRCSYATSMQKIRIAIERIEDFLKAN
jgi:aminotransferase